MQSKIVSVSCLLFVLIQYSFVQSAGAVHDYSCNENQNGNLKIDDHQLVEVRINSAKDLTVLCSGSVANMKHLRFLYLDSNNIREIRPGAFQALPMIYNLRLSFNILEKIEEGVFNGLVIRYLHLDNNRISDIDQSAFDNMTYLTYVQLEANRLKAINPNWFSNAPKVYSVLYNHNQIESVPDGAYKNFVKTVELPIYLMNNSISTIAPYAFEGISRIGDVYLSNNKLKSMNDSFFDAEYVRNVYLDDNELVCLSRGFQMTPVIGSVSIEGNPIACQCLLDTYYWTQMYNVSLVVSEERLRRCTFEVS